MNYQTKIDSQKISDYCKLNGIKKLSFFGSVLTEKFNVESDIDILIEFEENKIPGLLGVSRIQRELTELFGRQVDIRTPNELSKYFRENVIREAEVKYG